MEREEQYRLRLLPRLRMLVLVCKSGLVSGRLLWNAQFVEFWLWSSYFISGRFINQFFMAIDNGLAPAGSQAFLWSAVGSRGRGVLYCSGILTQWAKASILQILKDVHNSFWSQGLFCPCCWQGFAELCAGYLLSLVVEELQQALGESLLAMTFALLKHGGELRVNASILSQSHHWWPSSPCFPLSSDLAALAVAGDGRAKAHAGYKSGAKLVWMCVCQGSISPGSRALS